MQDDPFVDGDNPYKSPETVGAASSKNGSAEQFAPCPRCRGQSARKVKWTWWGGALGPSMLTHVRCELCGAKYNGKSGRYNTTGITVYLAVSLLLCVVILILLRTFSF